MYLIFVELLKRQMAVMQANESVGDDASIAEFTTITYNANGQPLSVTDAL